MPGHDNGQNTVRTGPKRGHPAQCLQCPIWFIPGLERSECWPACWVLRTQQNIEPSQWPCRWRDNGRKWRFRNQWSVYSSNSCILKTAHAVLSAIRTHTPARISRGKWTSIYGLPWVTHWGLGSHVIPDPDDDYSWPNASSAAKAITETSFGDGCPSGLLRVLRSSRVVLGHVGSYGTETYTKYHWRWKMAFHFLGFSAECNFPRVVPLSSTSW